MRIEQVINFIVTRVSSIFNAKISFHCRPVNSSLYNYSVVLNDVRECQVAIIVQGPLHQSSHITIETIKLYKRLYPSSAIIFSSWRGMQTHVARAIEGLGVHLLLNEMPDNAGAHNVNYQIVSTFNAIEMAKSLGCRYVLKTRTDMRFCRASSLSALISLLDMYPSSNVTSSEGRIIEIGSTSCRFRPWSLCDVFQFANIDDLYVFWKVQLDSRTGNAKEFFSKPRTAREVSAYNVAEIYLHRNYAKTLGYPSNTSVYECWDFVKNEIIIIDKELIDLCWFKYEHFEYLWVGDPGYGENQTLSRFSHAEWLSLYSNAIIDVAKLESYLDCYE